MCTAPGGMLCCSQPLCSTPNSGGCPSSPGEAWAPGAVLQGQRPGTRPALPGLREALHHPLLPDLHNDGSASEAEEQNPLGQGANADQ